MRAHWQGGAGAEVRSSARMSHSISHDRRNQLDPASRSVHILHTCTRLRVTAGSGPMEFLRSSLSATALMCCCVLCRAHAGELRPVLSPIGPAEVVWNKSRDACPDTKWVHRLHRNVPCEEPDSMPLAWHNPLTNRSYLISATDCTFAAIGPTLAGVSGPHDCGHAPYVAVNDSRPWSYANHQWLQSTRVFPNGSGFALIHNEFHGEQEDNESYCSFDSKTATGQCIEWSTDLGATTDGGATWHQTHAPLITLPRKYVKDASIAGYGELGAILRNSHDNYYYAHVARSYHNNTGAGPPNTVGNGSCVVRTANPSDPFSFRGWDGNGWNTEWANPYDVPPPTPADLRRRTCAAVDQGGDRSMHINPKQFAGPLTKIPGWPSHVLLAWPSGKRTPRVTYAFPAASGAADGAAPFTAWEVPTYLDLSGWFDPCTGLEELDFMYPNLIDHDSPFSLSSGTTREEAEDDLVKSDGLSYTLAGNRSLYIYAVLQREYIVRIPVAWFQEGQTLPPAAYPPPPQTPPRLNPTGCIKFKVVVGGKSGAAGVYTRQGKATDGTYLYVKDASHQLYHFQGAWVLGHKGVKRYYTAPSDDPERGVGVPYLWAARTCPGAEVPTVACLS